ncbi:hypothetical protein KP509_14G021700 [Ceratopteris richardii]|uniref:Uncharacterized protein n=1 Tax=Ceratopteris richardii TaxID=49495 RepID=A0A8T2T667_CERRI|nr:hypothetical protein KP509_14G021700 [Ceratopteris richardii]
MASHHPRKTPEVVKLQEVWCLCVGRVIPSSRAQPSNKLSKRETSRHSNQSHKAQIKGNLWTSTKSGEIKSTERDALMNEGVANRVNHGVLKSSNDGIPFPKLSIPAGCSSVVSDTLRWYQNSMDGSPLCACLQSVHSPSPAT